jgi:putative oxidoreductase
MQGCRPREGARVPQSTIAERFAPYTHALLRIVFGLLFLCHGLQKVFGLFDGRVAELASPRWFAGMIELVAGALITIGWFARPAAFLASGEMAVAYFLFQQPAGLWPIQNHGEPAVMFCFAFLYIAASGAGPFSVDSSQAPYRPTKM